jgi:hypothetical protein
VQIYTAEMGKEPKKPLLGDMLADNQFTRKIERRILSRMDSVRNMGNLGPHGEAVEASDATRVLEDLCSILDWYLQRYQASQTVGEAAASGSQAPGKAAPVIARRSRIRLWGFLGGVIALAAVAVIVVPGFWRGAPPRGDGLQHDRTVSPKGRVVLNALDTLTAVAADLEKTAADLRPQRRYLTLAHLHNNRRLPVADLQALRKTLHQFAQHLSPPGRLLAFQPVDAEETVYAIDLRELGWDDDTWRLLLRGYPYGLTYEGSTNASLRAAEQQVQRLSPSKLPYVRADWFMAAVVRPAPSVPAGAFKLPERPLPDAVNTLAQTYASQQLDLEAAAAELALSDPARLDTLIREQPRLRQKMHLGPLTQTGGTIRRDVWESMEYGASPFQEVSRELNLGEPIVVVR